MSNIPPFPDAPQDVLEKVQVEYEKTLVIPDHRPSPQWMLMPVGVVGAGKTTVVKPLAERLGLIRISTDEVRERLKQHGYSYEGARDIAHALSTKYLGLGYSIAVDGNAGSKSGLEYNKKNAETFPQVRQVFIHIDPPDEYIVNKLRNYQHTWLFKDAEHAIESFYKNKQEFVIPDLPFVYTFNPSGDNLPMQLEAGVRAIEERLKTQ